MSKNAHLRERIKKMVNENRVRMMTQIAAYEQGNGREDLKILQYFRGDYIIRKMIQTWIYTTIAYGILAGIYAVLCIDQLFSVVQNNEIMSEVTKMIGIYLLFEVFFLVLSFFLYKKKYEKAKASAKKYHVRLKRLEIEYEKKQKGAGHDDRNTKKT